MARNLIKNPSGEEGLKYWEEIQNGGDGWKVKDDYEDPKCPCPMKYFAGSFEQCSKSQTIDLLKEGYTAAALDAQPTILVSDWYATRHDCGSSYELHVKLLSDSREVIAEYNVNYKAIPMDGSAWYQVSHAFKKYGPGVRFIKFSHGGKDTRFWKGYFGIHVTKSSVVIN